MKKIIVSGIALISLLIAFGCASTSYLGNWDYTVKDMMQGDQTGVFTITETEEGYICHVESSDGLAVFDMESCSIEENVFTGYYYDQGTRVDVTGTFEGDSFSGSLDVGGTMIPVEMTRLKD